MAINYEGQYQSGNERQEGRDEVFELPRVPIARIKARVQF